MTNKPNTRLGLKSFDISRVLTYHVRFYDNSCEISREVIKFCGLVLKFPRDMSRRSVFMSNNISNDCSCEISREVVKFYGLSFQLFYGYEYHVK